MQEGFDANLFVSTDYIPYLFQHKDIKEQILHGSISCTDYDLTGQIIWPSSQALSKYIVDNNQQFQNKTIIQLGAGAGLAGIIAANYAKQVILTDGIDIVVDLLELNKQKSRHKQKLKVQLFDWKQHQQFFNKEDRSNIEYVIGADIVFWPNSMEPLCQVMNKFLTVYNATIIIAVKNRSNNSQNQFSSYLQKYKLKKQILLKQEDHIEVYKVVKNTKQTQSPLL